MDNIEIKKHYENKIENAEDDIKELKEIKQKFSNPQNDELFRKLIGYSLGEKEVYQTLLNDLNKEV